MKIKENLYKKICSKENLYKAYRNARKGKGWYKDVKKVEKNLDFYISELQQLLITHQYKTSEYVVFNKIEGRKEREIYKLPFYPDRICQWAIIQVIEPYLIKNFTKDTYSAIPKRGIQPIVDQLGGHYKIYKKNGKEISRKWIPSILVSNPEDTKYCLKLDIRKYYPTIVHSILKEKLKKVFKDQELLWLLNEIIDSVSTCPATEENIKFFRAAGEKIEIVKDNQGKEFIKGIGIPIGNYVSQYDGNFYLSTFDHWLKEVKGIKYYFRYMDDIVIFNSSKEKLHQLKEEINEFLFKDLKQIIKNNWQIFPSLIRGIDFVGYRFFGNYTLLRKTTCINFKNKMNLISKRRIKGQKLTYNQWCSFNSYKGWLQHCNSCKLYQKYIKPNQVYIDRYYIKEVRGNAEI